MTPSLDPQSPLVIGGLGGSGTRVLAEIARDLGVHLGHDVSRALDNQTVTLLLKRPSRRREATATRTHASLDLLTKLSTTDDRLTPSERLHVIRAAAERARPHKRSWLARRAWMALRRDRMPEVVPIDWGWKEPNSHILLDLLDRHYPQLRYIHVIRHGLDMALSGNTNQLRNWHWVFDLPAPPTAGRPPAREALRFWCLANTRALELGAALGPRFLAVRFDDLCERPAEVVPQVVDFIAGDVDSDTLARLIRLPRPPESTGRFHSLDLASLDTADLATVEELGFRI